MPATIESPPMIATKIVRQFHSGLIIIKAKKAITVKTAKTPASYFPNLAANFATKPLLVIDMLNEK